MNLIVLRELVDRAIKSAGPRYTPGLEPESPNIEIDELEDALAGLAVSARFEALVRREITQFDRAVNDLGGVGELANSVQSHGGSVARCLLALCTRSPRIGAIFVERATAGLSVIEGLLAAADTTLRKKLETARAQKAQAAGSTSAIPGEDVRQLERTVDLIYSAQRATYALRSLANGNAVRLRINNRALLLGPWGAGKTHLLCDVAKHALDAGRPACLLLAKDSDYTLSIFDGMAKLAGQPTFDQLLKELNAAGRAKRCRALLLIDGINEGDQNGWRTNVRRLREKLAGTPYVGLVLSCREPMDQLIVPGSSRKRFVLLHHEGFSDVQFDAQKEFFRFYEIPLPEVPLLAEEFSRPLTLKILCESFHELPKKEQKAGFEGIASGQRGMTFILESFIKKRSQQVEKDFCLPSKFCWQYVKGFDGKSIDPLFAGLAPFIAATGHEQVPKNHAISILVGRVPGMDAGRASALIDRMVQEGVLYEHGRFREGVTSSNGSSGCRTSDSVTTSSHVTCCTSTWKKRRLPPFGAASDGGCHWVTYLQSRKASSATRNPTGPKR